MTRRNITLGSLLPMIEEMFGEVPTNSVVTLTEGGNHIHTCHPIPASDDVNGFSILSDVIAMDLRDAGDIDRASMVYLTDDLGTAFACDVLMQIALPVHIAVVLQIHDGKWVNVRHAHNRGTLPGIKEAS